ncbi:hypothetical protein ACN08Z_05500 [Rothia sp. P7181]|uniref:hypothetical protein n=1 Tax=Rothia sp. P7181 TaxID=3402663 RepID=UPI003ADC3863
MSDLGIKGDSKTAREAVRQLRAVLSMSIQLSTIVEDGEGGHVVTELEMKVGSGREIHFDANADVKERESHLLLSQEFTKDSSA